MKQNSKRVQWGMGLVLGLTAGMVLSQETGPKKSSYAPVAIEKDFATVMAEMKRAKPELAKRHLALLEERYILSNQAESQVTMFRGKPIQKGVRAKLTAGTTLGIVEPGDSRGDPREESVSQRFPCSATSQPSRRGNAFSEVSH